MSTSSRKTVPFSRWPEADQAAWNQAVQGGALLDGQGPAAHWSKKSKLNAQQGFGRWLQFVQNNGGPLSSGIKALNQTRVADFIRHLDNEVKPVTVSTQVNWLRDAARVMAPNQDWDWLQGIARQVSRRPDARLKSLPPIVDNLDLLELGFDLMEKAESGSHKKATLNAVQYRDGLIIALLAYRPLRRRTLACIRIGQQLQAIGEHWWLVLGAENVKTKRPEEHVWPEALIPNLGRYLDQYRECFKGAHEQDALWLSAKGGALSADGFYQAVTRRTKKAFGFAVSPHQFRHAAASAISRHDPEHVMIVKSVLGHTSLRMAHRHYIQTHGREANRKYQSLITKLRKKSKADTQRT